MKIVPEEYTKSAPNTTITVAGKQNAQYVAVGSITANRMAAVAVSSVPLTGLQVSPTCYNIPRRAVPAKMTKGNLATNIATKTLHKQPTMNNGMNRSIVCTGVSKR